MPTTRVASLPPPIPQNPYQRLLYDALRAHGVELVPSPRLYAGWLLRNRGRVDVLHFHWPMPYYRHDRGRPALRPLLSWVRLCVFAGRLALARALGYRIVWTVHEVDPHETTSRRLDRAAARLLARFSDSLIAHDETTAAAVRAAIPSAAARTVLVPHATYAGFYPHGRDRDAVRAELGIAPDAFVVLCFGHVREYKDINVLLEAFHDLRDDRALLVVAGLPLSETAAATLRAAAAADPRIKLRLEFVPDDQVEELFRASDVAVVSRGDGGTSGVLVLALSLGVPVVAAAQPAYEALTGHGEAGWHFEPGDPASLAAVLSGAAADREGRRARAARAAERGAATTWAETAAVTARVLRGG
jgi:glycosyltransferase involved in cell wall biosynthesis